MKTPKFIKSKDGLIIGPIPAIGSGTISRYFNFMEIHPYVLPPLQWEFHRSAWRNSCFWN